MPVRNIFKGIANSILKKADIEAIASVRLYICHSCDNFDNGRCKICGCVLSWKTRVAAEQCPIDPPKWKAIK